MTTPPDGAAGWPSPEPPETPETDEQRRQRSAGAAAAWVAAVGGALVLVAAIVVVTSNWQEIGPALRFAGLVFGSFGLGLAAERVRPRVPTTASITAQLVALLTVPVGVAGASMLGQPWPVCLVVGGTLAVLATQVQAARWNAPTLLGAQVGAVALLVTGAATLSDVPTGLLGAVAAIGLLAIGAERRAAALAIAAVCSPALVALADAGIGTGTLERAGLVGERLGWSGPLTGLLAAGVLGVVAARRKNLGLTVAAIAAPILGVITGIAAADGGNVAWWSVPALAVISLELGWWATNDERIRAWLGSVADITGTVAAATGLIAPAFVFVALWVDSSPTHKWAIPTGLSALALVLLAARWKHFGGTFTDLAIGAAAITILSTGVALELAPPLLGGLSVALVAGAAFMSRRLARTAIYPPTLWALVMIARIGEHTTADTIIGGVLLALLVGVVLVARTRLAFRQPVAGGFEMVTFAAVVGLAATALIDGHGGPAWFAAVVVAIAMMLAIEPRLTDWSVLTLGSAGLLGTLAASDAILLTFDSWIAVGWFAAAATLLAHGLRSRSDVCIHGAAAGALFALAALLPVTSVTLEGAIGLGVALMAVLTGLAFTSRRFTPVDTAAIATSGVLVVLTALSPEPTWAAGAWLAIGLQIICYGIERTSRPLQLLGTGVSAASAIAWWVVSGLHDWLLDELVPYDIVETDLANFAAMTALLAAGLVGRRLVTINSWLAYGPGLVYGAIWLLEVQLERDTMWAASAALGVGLAAIAVGGWRRLGAPLVLGTGLVAGTVLVAAGDRLADLPTWIWLAGGGLGLLGLAFAIERAGREGVTELRALVDRWD